MALPPPRARTIPRLWQVPVRSHPLPLFRRIVSSSVPFPGHLHAPHLDDGTSVADPRIHPGGLRPPYGSLRDRRGPRAALSRSRGKVQLLQDGAQTAPQATRPPPLCEDVSGRRRSVVRPARARRSRRATLDTTGRRRLRRLRRPGPDRTFQVCVTSKKRTRGRQARCAGTQSASGAQSPLRCPFKVGTRMPRAQPRDGRCGFSLGHGQPLP